MEGIVMLRNQAASPHHQLESLQQALWAVSMM